MTEVDCREATCAAKIIFAKNPKGHLVAFDAKTFLETEVPQENAWLLVEDGKVLRATKDGTRERIAVYVAHHVTCPGVDVRGVKSEALRRRRDEYRRSALHLDA